MSVQFFIDGDDFSNYVVSSSRTHSICNPVGSLTVQMSPDIPRAITTYEPVVFYENGTKVFTGYTGSVNISRLPASYSLTCYDVLIKAKDKWIKDKNEMISNGESVGYWVSKFLGRADIHGLIVDDPGDQGVYPGFGWNNQTCLDACGQVLQMSPFQIYCDRDGKVHLTSMDRGAPSKTLSELVSFERTQNDRWVRNRLVVIGTAPAVADVFAPNEYIPGEIRAAIVATGAIHNEVTASELAERMREEFSKPLDTKVVVIPGDPTLELGQTVRLVENWSSYNELCLITGLTAEYTDNGYTIELTLDEKCPNFWGWDSGPGVPIIIYAGTWGEGVFRYEGPGGSWSETNLGDKYVYDIHVVDDITVWAACRDGVYQTRDHGDNWHRFTMGNPGDLRDGEIITEADLYWVGVVTAHSNSDAIYCLAGEFGDRGIWIYYSTNTGADWHSTRIV